jgi:toxin ParE1/3/4
MATIVRSPESRQDILEIAHYIALDNPSAAEQLVDQFDDVLNMLARNPLAGRIRDDLAKDLRSFAVKSYILFYRAKIDGIELVRVLHGARDLRQLFKRSSG